MSATDELLRNNERYAQVFDKGDLPLPPAKGVAVVACMDARLNVYGMLGLQEGDAHVIRNAGGVVTDDEIRSLTISQRLLGTREIVLIHHTDCGMLTFTDDELKRQIQEEVGIKPEFAMRPSPTSKGTCANPCGASGRAPSSRTKTACAGSSTRSKPAGCARLTSRRSCTFETEAQGGEPCARG